MKKNNVLYGGYRTDQLLPRAVKGVHLARKRKGGKRGRNAQKTGHRSGHTSGAVLVVDGVMLFTPPHRKAALATGEVDNPGFSANHGASPSNPRRTRAVYNVNESTISRLYHRKLIDSAQAEAALRLRALYEAMITSLRSSSDLVEPVDGGGAADVFSGRMIDAGKRLKQIHEHMVKHTGPVGWNLIVDVAACSMTLEKAAGKHKLRRQKASRLFKTGLTQLAAHMGLQQHANDNDNATRPAPIRTTDRPLHPYTDRS